METIVPIKGFSGYYASNIGKIYSDKYLVRRELKQRKNHKGYVYVNLCENGKCRSIEVQRLIAISFLPDYDGGLEVNHINGIKDDNRVENLEMVTHSGNMQHAVRSGLLKSRCGEKHHSAKLTSDDVREIRLRATGGESTSKLSREYGVTPGAIRQIIFGKTWRSVV